jgi:two-component sensor histidine kinase
VISPQAELVVLGKGFPELGGEPLKPQRLQAIWAVATAVFILAVGALTITSLLADRAALLRTAQERTASTTRLLIAHGNAAIEDANKVLAAIEESVAEWDLADEAKGRQIFEKLPGLFSGSPQISSAWVLDGKGISRLDSWSYPSRPLDGSSRPYFQAHLRGAADPVIVGDDRPGAITGKERFTFSRALRNPDGSLRAVLVVGIYSAHFDAIYQDAATWPGARAGLYTHGHVLGRLRSPERASPEFIAEIEAAMAVTPIGTKMIMEHGRPRIVSWNRSEKYPAVYATSSQPVDAALEGWATRAWALSLSALLGVAGFLALALYGSRAAEARNAAQLNETLAREVHHRIKNSLQMVTALLNLRSRQSSSSETKAAMTSVAAQIAAISNVHEALQSTTHLDRVDLCDLLRILSENMAMTTDKKVIFTGAPVPVVEEASRASLVAIVVNEVATNSLKHARELVEIGCALTDGGLEITIDDDGPGLPTDFEEKGIKKRFGLRTAMSLASRAKGELTWSTSPAGTTFRLSLPTEPAPNSANVA